MVGSLLFLVTSTRPDMYYFAVLLSKGMATPTQAVLRLAKRGLRFVKGTIDWGLFFKQDSALIGYSDSDFAGPNFGRKSLTGFCFLYNGAAITSGTKQQPLVCLSTCEAEYLALSQSAKEAMYLRQLLEELQIWSSEDPVVILGDNECANQLTADPVAHQRTKHIGLRYHHIRQLVEDQKIVINKVFTDDNLADLFTKALPAARHHLLAKLVLGMG